MGEWYSGGSQGWQDPDGLRVNLYHESCPPELAPYLSIEISWDDLDKTLVESTGSRWVYEVHVPLSPVVTVEPGMSLGATVLIDWGTAEPFCGIVATPMWVSYGACPAYLDGQNWGYIRWTAIDEFTTIDQDLAYCLEGPTSDVAQAGHGALGLCAWPNPFNPQTTITFSLVQGEWVELGIYDLSGHLVRALAGQPYTAGAHSIVWNGKDETGDAVPSGSYIVRLETKAGAESQKISLIR